MRAWSTEWMLTRELEVQFQPSAPPGRQPLLCPTPLIAEAPQTPESEVLFPWGRDQEVVLESSEKQFVQ